MSFKILNIRAFNFKAFEKIDFNCNGKNAVILGGKNGFGKTSLFDIIELVLTGQIKRYADYAQQFIDGRLQKEGFGKPIVNRADEKKVWVEVLVEIDGVKYLFHRETETKNISFQIDFHAFDKLDLFKYGESSEKIPITDEFLVKNITSNFNRYYYIAQEEALSYIKSKEKDRPETLLNLFNVEYFESRISKINEAIKLVQQEKESTKKIIDGLRESIEKIDAELEDKISISATVPYKRLTDSVSFLWDSENPGQNFPYQDVLQENGLIENLLYYVQHSDDYFVYRKNKFFKDLKENKENFVYYLFFKNLNDKIDQYNSFKKNCIEPIEHLSVQSLKYFSFESFKVLGIEVPQELEQALNALNLAEKSLAYSNRLLSIMNDVRLLMKNHESDYNSITKCPLCGHDYTKSINLRNAIFNEKIVDTSIDLSEQIDSFKKLVKEKIIQSQVNRFNEWQINDENVRKYNSLSKEKMYSFEEKFVKFSVFDSKGYHTLKDLILEVDAIITSNTVQLNESVDYSRIDRVYNEVGRYLNPCTTEDDIKGKRQYLINKWRDANLAEKNSIVNTIIPLNTRQEKNISLENKLKMAEKSLKKAEREYLAKIINDVKILFFIYSGRIMQDCFYGRGLFLIYNPQKGYVNFTTTPNSCVDALYNLSSGQLIALILAFTMSLNKLYHKFDFMLIDDPIQCIDDINVWGFIETLRHEFQNYSFIFSTHEPQYGSLLRYRLSNFGFNAEYRDLFAEGIRK